MLRGIVGFGIIIAQGIAVGIIFGIVTSKTKVLHPSSKRRGISFGLATGIIAFMFLYLPLVSNITSTSLVRYAPADIYTMGVQTTAINNNNKLVYFPSSTAASISTTLGFGIFAYLVYGFLMGGIVTLAYSVYNFDVHRIEEHNDKGDQQRRGAMTQR